MLLLTLNDASGQSRKQLEQKRKRLIEEIRTTSQELKNTTKNKEVTLDRYLSLQSQIQKRQELIETLNNELDYAEENINRTSDVIFSLEQDMERLQEEYGQMARQAYRQKVQQNSWLFIFSASTFNQAFQRWQYLKQYNQSRKKTAELIVSTQISLNQKLEQLEEDKSIKALLLLTEVEQEAEINLEMESKNQLLNALQADEARLAKALEKQQKKHRRLNEAIESVIRKEIAANRKRERSRLSLADANKGKVNKKRNLRPPSSARRNPRPKPARGQLSQEFSQNRGQLSWPVQNGVVTKYFGKQAHPTLRGIQITNNGIDIKTQPKTSVQAVFKGEIVGVQFIPGYNYMVIIKHGSYYTVYSNLEQVVVKKGENVNSQQHIGRVSINPASQTSEVHFEVWKDKTRLNPIKWIN
ncbi:MAG: peptidoglycan DD-metalloendopeptidase family protein [Bacteroidota bacterium]